MLTMLLGGLWHGANWTFVVWGGIHGGGLAVERAILTEDDAAPRPSLVRSWIRRIVVFHLVCIAWIFFRAPSIPAALDMLGGFGVWQWRGAYWVAFKFLALFSLPLMLLDQQLEKTGDEYVLQSAGWTWRIAVALPYTKTDYCGLFRSKPK